MRDERRIRKICGGPKRKTAELSSQQGNIASNNVYSHIRARTSIFGIGTTIFQIEIRLPEGALLGASGGTLLYCQNVFAIETDC